MRQEDEANEAGGMLVAHVMIEVIWRAPDQPGNPATGGEEEDDEEERRRAEGRGEGNEGRQQ